MSDIILLVFVILYFVSILLSIEYGRCSYETDDKIEKEYEDYELYVKGVS
jgi:hypothetical protein